MVDIIHVPVTKAHIANAMKKNSHHCAIAQAIKESSEDFAWVAVTAASIEFGRHSTEMREKYRAPNGVREFVRAFDENRGPKPFTVIVRPDDLISIRPRAMRQKIAEVERQQRKFVAKVTKRPMREVTIEDVHEYAKALEEQDATPIKTTSTRRGTSVSPPSTKRPAPLPPLPAAGVKTAVRKTKTATTGTPRKYNRRPTIAETLKDAGW